jgi:ligand-binding SRPBCC domain-containing protein
LNRASADAEHRAARRHRANRFWAWLLKSYQLKREQWIPQPIEEVFAFFGDARNLEAITPAWLGFRILSPEPIVMRAETHIVYRLSWHRVPIRWVTKIFCWDPPTGFVDVQIHGPYSHWHHSHSFRSVDGKTLMRDVVRYGLPFGMVGQLAHHLLVKSDLNAIFDYRARKIAELLGAGVRS